MAKEALATTFGGALLGITKFRTTPLASEDLCASPKIRFTACRPMFFTFPELQNQLYSVVKLKRSSGSPSGSNLVI